MKKGRIFLVEDEIEQYKRNIQDLQIDRSPNRTLIRNEELALGIKQVSRDKLIR